MTFAEKKIDYSPIPVIEVARILLGSENRERTTHDEIHFHGHSGLFVNPKKNKWRSHGEGVGGDAIALISTHTSAISGRRLIGSGRMASRNILARRPRSPERSSRHTAIKMRAAPSFITSIGLTTKASVSGGR